MNQIMECKDMNMEEAMELCRQEYEKEREHAAGMPPMDKAIEEKLLEVVHSAKEAPYGKALYKDGKLTGFLAFFGPWEEFHGTEKGVFSPLGASAFGETERGKTASLLFQAAARELVRDGIFGIAISRYADLEEVNRLFVLSGFGIRCSDAVLSLKEYEFSDKDSKVVIGELKQEERAELAPLFEKLQKHLSVSPCFFPKQEGQAGEWLADQGIRILAARHEGSIAGYMAVHEEAETFLTESAAVTNICGAYVAEEYRSAGVAKQLLDAIVQMCIAEGKSYLGVDYETVNPTALRFWTKYFTPYTYSFMRRIDERMRLPYFRNLLQ